jgi:SecD-like export protein
MMRFFTGERWSARKMTIAVLASIGIVAMLSTIVVGVAMSLLMKDQGQAAPRPSVTPTARAPVVIGAPLAVRPVVEQPLVATPEDCPAGVPTPPSDPVRLCDVDNAAVYQLGPVALRLNLTGATETKLPTSDFHTVQMSMDPDSSTAFAQYTAANVGRQLAFVRDGVVLAAPAINQPIDGQSLQISGELSAGTAATIARMLREGT